MALKACVNRRIAWETEILRSKFVESIVEYINNNFNEFVSS